MTPSRIEDARAFLAHAKRLAVVGVSRDQQDFSRYVVRELVRGGHEVVPVNPALREAEGLAAFARVQDVAPPPDAALLLVPRGRAEDAVRDCLVARVKRIWFHQGSGPGASSETALALCRANAVEVVQGLCPMMVLPASSFPHRLHGFVRRTLAHGRRRHGAVP